MSDGLYICSDISGTDSDEEYIVLSSRTSSPSSRALLSLFSTVLLSISSLNSEGKLCAPLCNGNPTRTLESLNLFSFVIVEGLDSKRL